MNYVGQGGLNYLILVAITIIVSLVVVGVVVSINPEINNKSSNSEIETPVKWEVRENVDNNNSVSNLKKDEIEKKDVNVVNIDSNSFIENKPTLSEDKSILDINKSSVDLNKIAADTNKQKENTNSNANYSNSASSSTRITVTQSNELVVVESSVVPSSEESKTTFSSGNGTSTDPYVIKNCDQLQLISSNMPGHFKVGNNIDCADTTKWNEGHGFIPQALRDSDFDGQGYTISNVFINRESTNVQALFGWVINSTIRNLKLTNAHVVGFDYVGGVVGSTRDSNISKVSVDGFISGNLFIGGIAGYMDRTTISDCYANVNVHSKQGIMFGGLTWADERSHGLYGVLDEVAVWNRVLSDSEIQSLYNNGDGVNLI